MLKTMFVKGCMVLPTSKLTGRIVKDENGITLYEIEVTCQNIRDLFSI